MERAISSKQKMLSSPLFRRNFLLFTVLVMVFVTLGGVLNWVYRDFQRTRIVNLLPFPVLISGLLEEIDNDPVVAVQKALRNEKLRESENIDVISLDGNSVITGRPVLKEPLVGEDLETLKKGMPVMRHLQGGPPTTITPTKRAGYFFYVSPKLKNGVPPPMAPPMFAPMASLMVSVMLAIGVALYIMSRTYKKKSEEALKVLAAIRSGDLGARLNTQGMDELKPIVNSFNAMADEVSALVESLQHTDSARRRLLQDLAHDLRTPLTSVKSFLDTLKNSSDKISAERRMEAINYCVSEVEYFSDLVEDLLFLANISEPKYVLAHDKIDILSLLQDVVTLFQAQHTDKNIFCEVATKDRPILTGSQKLFERLLRNIFANAISFSKDKVEVFVSTTKHNLCVRFVDNGPGFSAEALATFGVKKAIRQVFKNDEGSRISLGIGSLIMKEIVMVHRGTLTHYNLIENGQVLGAVIEINLPIS